MTPPRTPVLVGYGQVNQRDEEPSVEPIDLMAAAARAAADPRVLEALELPLEDGLAASASAAGGSAPKSSRKGAGRRPRARSRGLRQAEARLRFDVEESDGVEHLGHGRGAGRLRGSAGARARPGDRLRP
jgi:hypothetical protein